MRVLVVDDDAAGRLMLQQVLVGLGHEVDCAVDGQDAWEQHRRAAYPLIVCDWMMPRLSGVELCKSVRALAQTSYTYVMITTTLSGQAHFLEAMRAGADDFMTKPVNFDELKARLGVAERILRLHTHVTLLEGLLSICAYCKKIKDDKSKWQHVERFIENRTAVTFSHAICPTCRDRLLETGSAGT